MRKKSKYYTGTIIFGTPEAQDIFDKEKAQREAEIAKGRPPKPDSTKKATPTVGRGHELPIISTAAIELCLNALREQGINPDTPRGIETLLRMLGEVMNETITSIKLGDPQLKNIVSKFKHNLADARLIFCPNWHVYYNRFSTQKKIIGDRTCIIKTHTKSQKFVPMPLLCGAKYRGRRLKASLSSYLNYKYVPSPPPQRSKIKRSSKVGINIPKNILEAGRNGTNLCFDYDEAHKLDLEKTHSSEAIWIIYNNLIQSTGCLPDEINPLIWRQSDKAGTLSACQPALQSLSREMFSYLRSLDGRPLWTIDFSNYHLVLFLGSEAAKKINGRFDYYDDWTQRIVIRGKHPERGEVKKAFSAVLNGYPLWAIRKPEQKRKLSPPNRRFYEIIDSLVTILSKQFPKRIRHQEKPVLNKKPDNYWNKLGADIFYKCLSAGMEEIGAKKIGLPKYDSITFSADSEEEMERFRSA